MTLQEEVLQDKLNELPDERDIPREKRYAFASPRYAKDYDNDCHDISTDTGRYCDRLKFGFQMMHSGE